MSKKLLNKLLSAVLVLAICSASLFGCVITVNAQGTYNGTYTVSVGDESHHVALMSKYINARVTFNLDAGMGIGRFSVAKSNGQGGEYAAVSVKPVSATLLGGESIDAQQLTDSKSDYFLNLEFTELEDETVLEEIIFDPGSGRYFTSLTLDMTLEVGSSWYVERNKQYSVTVNVTDNEIATENWNAETHFDLSATENGKYHVHMAQTDWAPIPDDVATAADDHYTMVDTTCLLCGQTVKQVYANPYEQVSPLPLISGPWAHLLASGVTVNYDKYGSLSINVHGRFLYGSEPYVMVCDAAGNKIIDSKSGATKYSGSVALSKSDLAGTVLHSVNDKGEANDENIKTYTIGGLSARDIDTDLYITLAVNFNNTEIQFSNTIKFSLKDYALSVIDGNGVVYPESATEAVKTADKNVAAALCYYGEVANNELIFEHEEASNSVPTVEKTSDTWRQDKKIPNGEAYWFFGDPNLEGSGTADKPYLIKTSEQLAAVALWGGDSTAGNYYKVDDSVGVLYLCPNTDSFKTSSLDALKTSLGADKDSHNDTIKKWASNSTYAFQGHFDGNGVIIRGMAAVGSDTQSGLFPYVKGDVSFKNVTVTDSYITATNQAGGIVGFTTDWGDITSISFENCKVSGNYIELTDGKGNYAGLGGLAGSVLCPTNVVSVNNCLVINNTYQTANELESYAFFGHIAQSSGTKYSFKNSITDMAPWTSASNVLIDKLENYENIYTTVDVKANEFDGTPTNNDVKKITLTEITGDAATENTNLNFNSTWLAVEGGYPDLRAFHNLVLVSDGDNTHTLKCTISVDDIPCSVCGSAKAHDFSSSNQCVCGQMNKTVDVLKFLPESVRNVLSNETVYQTKFATNAKFMTAYQDQADNTVKNGTIEDCCLYASSLNLKTAPYISFTFAFNGDYRTNKANITATFTVDGQQLATVTGDQMINNAGAGRYHLYRLKSIPTTLMRKQVHVVVKYGDTTMVDGYYSAAGYAIKAINAGDEYRYHAEAAKSLVYYSEMLAARYSA